MRRLISLVFKICLGVTLVYYVGVNGFLMTPYAGKLMMMAPDIVQLRYSRAYSLVPFHIVAEDLRISVQDPAVQVYISADVASGDIYPWTLLNNTFYATNLKGEGLVFRLRERLDDEKIKPETAALMPPIPGYDSIALSPVPPPAKPLRVRLGSLHVTNLSEVWINEMKFDGRIDVDGSFEFEAFKFVEVPGVELNNVALQLTRAGKPMVKISSLVLKASLDEVSLVKVDTEKMLNGITASIAMQAQTQNIGFINSMIHDPDLILQEGSGKVTLDLSLRDGAFQDGSTVAFDTSRVVMQLPFFELAGRAAIRGEVKKGTTFFNVRVPELVGIQRKDSKKAFTATNIGLGECLEELERGDAEGGLGGAVRHVHWYRAAACELPAEPSARAGTPEAVGQRTVEHHAAGAACQGDPERGTQERAPGGNETEGRQLARERIDHVAWNAAGDQEREGGDE